MWSWTLSKSEELHKKTVKPPVCVCTLEHLLWLLTKVKNTEIKEWRKKWNCCNLSLTQHCISQCGSPSTCCEEWLKTVSATTLKKMKYTALTKHVKMNKTNGALKKFPFLVLISESTDIHLEKTVCVIAHCLLQLAQENLSCPNQWSTMPGNTLHRRSSEPLVTLWIRRPCPSGTQQAWLKTLYISWLALKPLLFQSLLSVLSWGEHCSLQSTQRRSFELRFQEHYWGQYFCTSVEVKTMTCSSEMWKSRNVRAKNKAVRVMNLAFFFFFFLQ